MAPMDVVDTVAAADTSSAAAPVGPMLLRSLPILIHLPYDAPPDERPLPCKTTTHAIRKWLDAADVPYNLAPFTFALTKVFQLRKARHLDVRLVLADDNLCFAQIYLTASAAALPAPAQLVVGNPASLFVFSHAPKSLKCLLPIKKPCIAAAGTSSTGTSATGMSSSGTSTAGTSSGTSAAPINPATSRAPARRPRAPISPCGFVDCDGSCGPAPVEQRKNFVLDRMLDDAAICGAKVSREAVSDNFAGDLYANSDLRDGDGLSRLPVDALHNIAKKCTARDLRALGRVNRVLNTATRHIIPGLDLKLYPHQCAALDRMIEMERRRPRRPDPLLRRLASTGPHHIVFDITDGSLYALRCIPTASLPRGGMIADEPGMGKTITGLALILKTLGFRAAPPSGVEEKLSTDMYQGKNVPYYLSNEMPLVQAGSEAGAVKECPKRSLRILNWVDSGKSFEENEAITARVLQRAVDLDRNRGRVLRNMRTFGEMVQPHTPVYLSCATVIFVPRELVVHWIRQIQKHCRNANLRMGIIRKNSDYPTKHQLAMDFDVLIVSYNALSSMHYCVKEKREEHPMVGVRFLRIIFDEGHKLGSGTNFHNACFLVKAERRFIMTGTPVSSTPNSDCEQLHSALHFLREPTFGLDYNAWTSAIRKPYNEFRTESLTRLQRVLGEIMIRTNKSSVAQIPGVNIANVFIRFTRENARSYNALVRVITRNLLTADWFRASHEQSLLNPSQGRQLNHVVSNLRRACNFGLSFEMKVSEKDLVSTLETLLHLSLTRRDGNLSKILRRDRQLAIRDHLHVRVPLRKNSLSSHFKESTDMFPDIDPAPYEIDLSPYEDDFRSSKFKFSSAVVSNWKIFLKYSGYLSEVAQAFRNGSRCQKCNASTSQLMVTPCAHLLCPECVLTSRTCCPVDNCRTPYKLDMNGVPEQMIELQPSIWNDSDWKLKWNTSASGKMEYLVDKLRAIKLENRKRKADVPPKKVIVFSQMNEVLMQVSAVLKTRNEFHEMVADFFVNECDISYSAHNADRHFDRQLRDFRNKPKCFILLLGSRKGSVGLDLSFVDTILLMEPVWDKALEKQVIARAHRLGAQSTIKVERLIMRDSVEEEVLRSSLSVTSGVKSAKRDMEESRKKKMITNLQLVEPAAINAADAQDGNVLPEPFISPLHTAYQSRIADLRAEEAESPAKGEKPKPKKRRKSTKSGRNVRRKLWT